MFLWHRQRDTKKLFHFYISAADTELGAGRREVNPGMLIRLSKVFLKLLCSFSPNTRRRPLHVIPLPLMCASPSLHGMLNQNICMGCWNNVPIMFLGPIIKTQVPIKTITERQACAPHKCPSQGHRLVPIKTIAETQACAPNKCPSQRDNYQWQQRPP